MAKQNFEDSMNRLEEITRELEGGELSLEMSLKKFEEGVRLAEYCNKTLADAEKKIELLVQKEKGLFPEPFSA